MILVIDAYNVLKQVLSTTAISEKIRMQFIKDVASYIHLKKHMAVIVFDAGPTQWPYKEHVSGVQVVYSGTRITADDYIKQFAHENSMRELLLISSDRALCLGVQKDNVESLDVREFYAILQQVINKREHKALSYQEKAVKMSTSQDADLDEIMLQASQYVPV